MKFIGPGYEILIFFTGYNTIVESVQYAVEKWRRWMEGADLTPAPSLVGQAWAKFTFRPI